MWTTTLLAAIASGLVGGVFLAFSSFIMSGLARLPAAQGIAAMQSINVTVLSSAFIAMFLLTAIASVGLAIGGLATWDKPGSALLIGGSVIYLVGAIGVTMVFNVPRNDALAAIEPTSPEGAALWSSYLSSWAAWNHVRMLASLGSCVAFVLALAARTKG